MTRSIKSSLRPRNLGRHPNTTSGIPVKTGIHLSLWIPAFAGMLILILMVITPAFAATTIPFTINMSESVNVTGTPRIAVDVDGNTRYATYSSGTGTSALTFTYAATAGDLDLNGVTLTSPIDLNGGTIKDLNGNNATLTFTVPDTSNIKINYPSLSMDFTADRYTLNGTAYNSISSFLTATGGTFSRSTTATYFDSTGTLQTAAANTPRFDYDPSTLAAKGLLIETSRTNILKQSNAFTTSPWTVCGGSTFPNTGSTTTAPDGSTVPIYDFPTTSCVSQDVTVTIGNPITHSIWIKANKAGTIGLRTPGTSAFTSTPIAVGTTWQRYTVTATAVSSTSRFLIDNRTVNGYGVTGLQVSFFGGQMEVGSYATSYIPTTSASVTRTADDFTIPTGSWYNASTSTLFTIFDSAQPTGSTFSAAAITLDDGTSNNAAVIRLAATKDSYVRTSNSNVATSTFGAYSTNTAIKSAMAIATNNVNTSYDGSISTTDTSVTFPTYTTLRIGSDRGGGNHTNGHIQKTKYYPARVSNTQLQLLTQ